MWVVPWYNASYMKSLELVRNVHDAVRPTRHRALLQLLPSSSSIERPIKVCRKYLIFYLTHLIIWFIDYLSAIGFTNWCSRIRSVLERTGLDQTWESQNIGDTNKFMLSFKESIIRIFTQQWRKYIESSSKLRTYALVKKYFCVEPYILHIRGNHLMCNGEISNELTWSKYRKRTIQ